VIAIDLFMREGCVACRRALALLRLTGRPVRARDILAEPLSWDELKGLAALAGGVRHIISTRTPAYHLHELAGPDIMDREMLSRMTADPDLIRRPIVLVDGIVLVGFDGETVEATPGAGGIR
jgi:arsenate reductase-like glutaredoxin family protein